MGRSRSLFLVAALVVSVQGIGCGGGSETEESSATAPPSSSRTAEEPSSPGTGDGSIQSYGREASATQRERFATLLEGYFKARAAHRWSDACSYLTSQLQEQYDRIAGGRGCATALRGQASRVSRATLAEEAKVEPLKLRLGDGAFLVYRDRRGATLAMPFARDGARWRLALVASAELD